jgi:hypothetical protein
MVPRSWWLTALAGLVIAALLPFVGHLIRGDAQHRCAWDGQEIELIYRVRIVEDAENTYEFCCLQCAELWLERRGHKPLRILVTDEASGQEIEAFKAYYVRSTVATNAVTGNRRHVFRTAEDALKHAEAAHGRRLLEDERPFAKPGLTEKAKP